MTDAPSPFSRHNPALQVAWDSTSLRAFQFCPRYYEYSILRGYRGTNVDLEFGILAHSALEVFYKARLAGQTKVEAQMEAVRWALEHSGHYERCEEGDEGAKPQTFDYDLTEGWEKWVPWGGYYEEMWRCTGAEPYKNAKGNRAKCPYSHVGAWFPMPAPSLCSCGSEVETQRLWLPGDKVKDRHGLIRLVVWYTDEQPEELEDGIAPMTLSDGSPAVELPFRIPLPFTNGYGETYLLAGYFDRFGKFGNSNFVADLKTSKHALSGKYFRGFSPHTQMDNYDLASWLLFPDLEISGVLIDAVQLLQGGARFGKHIIYHDEAKRQELLNEIKMWLEDAERAAEAGYWKMNRANCWNCGFNGICAMTPAARDRNLEANFERRHWNPLEER